MKKMNCCYYLKNCCYCQMKMSYQNLKIILIQMNFQQIYPFPFS